MWLQLKIANIFLCFLSRQAPWQHKSHSGEGLLLRLLFSGTVHHRHPHKGHGQTAHHINDGVLLSEHGGRTDQCSPPQARIFQAGRSFASLLWLNASAMQAELWQWMDGHTLTEASALQISCMMLIAMLLRPTASTVGRISRPLGSKYVQDQAEGHAGKHGQAELS